MPDSGPERRGGGQPGLRRVWQASLGSDTNPTPYGYGGQAGYYTDSETGLCAVLWRYYDPNTGRWLNRDPIGYAGGRNLYAYCGGNPVGRLDPLGLAADDDDPFAEVDAYRRAMGNWSAAWDDKANEQRNRDLAQIGAADQACKKPFAREGLKWAATKTVMMAMDVASLGGVGELADVGIGLAKAGAEGAGKFLSRGALRRGLMELVPEGAELGMESHHVFPWKLREEFYKLGIDVSEAEYGAWVDPAAHRGWSYEYNRAWEDFLRTTRAPGEILDFARLLADQYGFGLFF